MITLTFEHMSGCRFAPAEKRCNAIPCVEVRADEESLRSSAAVESVRPEETRSISVCCALFELAGWLIRNAADLSITVTSALCNAVKTACRAIEERTQVFLTIFSRNLVYRLQSLRL